MLCYVMHCLYVYLPFNLRRTKSWPKALEALHARNCIHKDCDQIRAVYGLWVWCLLRNRRLTCSTFLVKLISKLFRRTCRSWIRCHFLAGVLCGRNVAICRILSWRTWCLTGLEVLWTGAHQYMQCQNGSFGLLSLCFASLYQIPPSIWNMPLTFNTNWQSQFEIGHRPPPANAKVDWDTLSGNQSPVKARSSATLRISALQGSIFLQFRSNRKQYTFLYRFTPFCTGLHVHVQAVQDSAG